MSKSFCFPEINKKEFVQYIYDLITINKYDNDLYNLNWMNYDIEKLDFEKINILLYELDNFKKKKVDLKYLHNNINNIIYSLEDIKIY